MATNRKAAHLELSYSIASRAKMKCAALLQSLKCTVTFNTQGSSEFFTQVFPPLLGEQEILVVETRRIHSVVT